MPRFNVHIECDAVIDIDEAVIRAVDDEWRDNFYSLHTPQEIAEHIGINLIVNRLRLSQLDGFADQEDDAAEIVEESWC